MRTHAELTAKMLADRRTRKAYDALKEEFTGLDSLLKVRAQAGLSQDKIARRDSRERKRRLQNQF